FSHGADGATAMRAAVIHRAGICLAAAIAGWLATIPAFAADKLKIAVGQREIWDGAPAALGERAGIFRKHDLDLELLFTSGSGETMQAVIAGSVDIGVAAGTLGVMGAYAKGADSHHRGGIDRRGFVLVRAGGFAGQIDGRHEGSDHGLLDQRLVTHANA